jgi:hypothetical protein
MTTLTIPPLERRLLQAVSEEVAAGPAHEWADQSLQLSVVVLRKIRENTPTMRGMLENILADGVEARSFTRAYGPLLPAVDDRLAQVRGLLEWLSTAAHGAAGSLAEELRLLEQETRAIRDLLAEALSRASETPRPVDWGRVRAAEEAHERGETKPFSRR